MTRGVEDLRTKLQVGIDLEEQLRGSIAGFMMPQFVVDLPGWGGKRPVTSCLSYDKGRGVSTFVGVLRGSVPRKKKFKYYDPIATFIRAA
jgi:lysine 2,3-aminomutase